MCRSGMKHWLLVGEFVSCMFTFMYFECCCIQVQFLSPSTVLSIINLIILRKQLHFKTYLLAQTGTNDLLLKLSLTLWCNIYLGVATTKKWSWAPWTLFLGAWMEISMVLHGTACDKPKTFLTKHGKSAVQCTSLSTNCIYVKTHWLKLLGCIG